MALIDSFPDDDEQDDDEDDSSDGDEPKKDNLVDGKNVQNRIFLNNFIAKSGGGEKGEKEKNVSESSDSDPEEGIKKNPMFPLLY